jgi:hypothetical protein
LRRRGRDQPAVVPDRYEAPRPARRQNACHRSAGSAEPSVTGQPADSRGRDADRRADGGGGDRASRRRR